jgi:hypothetical protein
MQRRAKASTSTALLTIRGEAFAWGMPSSAVIGVEAFERVSGEAPPDMLTLLGAASSLPEHEARVLRLRIGQQRLAVLVRGTLSLVEASPDDLLALPAALAGRTPLISHVALVDGKPSLFVVSPERLLEACRARKLPPTSPPLPDRGSPC